MYIVEISQLLSFFKNKTQEHYLKKSSYITHIVKQFSLGTRFQTFLAFLELSRYLFAILTAFALHTSMRKYCSGHFFSCLILQFTCSSRDITYLC